MFRTIVAMSTELKNIKDSIRNSCDQLDEHLIKLALYPNCDSKDHWRAEVYSYLNKVPKLRGSNKFPKFHIIRTELATYEDMMDNIITVVKKNYRNLTPVDIDDNTILNIITEYHDWIAQELSQYGIVSSLEVFDKLEELGL